MSSAMVDKPHQQKATKPKISKAFITLASLPPDTDKQTLINSIDAAVTDVLSDLSNHESGDLPPDILMKVQTSLTFLERCNGFDDVEFTRFSKKRANELQLALSNAIARIHTPVEEPEKEPAPAAVQEVPQEPENQELDEPEEETFDPKAFLYKREEKILIDFAYDLLTKRLAFLRGDSIKVENQKQVHVSGIHEDGVSHLFLISPELPRLIRDPLRELIQEKRDLFSRRVYVHCDKSDSDEDVLNMYKEERRRDIVGILALAFDDWAGEIARAGMGGLPQEIQVIKPKTQEKEDGIGSSLKKVFSFGKKEKKSKAKTKTVEVPDTTPVRIYKEWQSLENQNVIDLSQHFSFGLLSYALQLSEKQFETEYECISQIVNQQDEPDVGPVITNLSRLYKFYDNIFFDLVIVVLFHRTNKFDINMLQAACMSQNFVVDRLPLTMDELRRRPLEHAKHIVRCLKEDTLDKEKIRQALIDYFHVHETIHASKVGKRIQASENHLHRQGEKLPEVAKKVVDEIEFILRDINNLKTQQEEEGVFLGEEIETTIEEGIGRAVMHL